MLTNLVFEEREALGRIGDAGLFNRQLQPHRVAQVPGERGLFVFGLLLGASDENDEVIGISDRKEKGGG